MRWKEVFNRGPDVRVGDKEDNFITNRFQKMFTDDSVIKKYMMMMG